MRLVTLPEKEFLEFRKQAAYVATHTGRLSDRLDLAKLGQDLDKVWIEIQPEYGPGLNSPEGPVITRS